MTVAIILAVYVLEAKPEIVSPKLNVSPHSSVSRLVIYIDNTDEIFVVKKYLTK